MKKDKRLFNKRNEQINKEYTELGKEGFLHDATIEKLSEKYFLSPRTIYAIISGEYEKRQTKSNP